MKHSVVITGQRERGLLHSLGITFFQRDVFPDLFHCEWTSSGTVQIDMVLDCDKESVDLLLSSWKSTPGIQSVAVTLNMGGVVTP